jgi:hypothetical protein
MKNLFISSKTILKTLSGLAVLLLAFTGCNQDTEPSAYNPNISVTATPVITSVSPESSAFAGVTVITITGQNFSSDISQDYVDFDETSGTILSATPTQITVVPPNLVSDTVKIRVAVQTALKFGYYTDNSGNKKLFSLKTATSEYGNFKHAVEFPYAIASDAQGNLYASMTTYSVGSGIVKITPDGVRTTWAPKGGETSWTSLAFGPDGNLYGARNMKAIFSIVAGAKSTTFSTAFNGSIAALDFDNSGNIWAVGTGAYIYSVTSAKVAKAFSLTGSTVTLRAVKVYNNYVYFAGSFDGVEKIYKASITSSSQIGSVEEVFNFSSSIATGYSIYSLTFDKNGNMYVGSDYTDPILVVKADKSFTKLYSGVLYPKAQSFAWGAGSTGNYLYYSRGRVDTSETVVRVNFGESIAP